MATTYGWITGRVIQPIGDTETAVDRTPTDRPSAGEVILTPLVAATTGDALVARDSIRRPLDADGWIVDLDGVAAVAVPVGSYRVEWALTSGRWPAHDITVTASHTKAAPYDIGQQAPVAPAPGAPLTLLQVPSGAFDGAAVGWEDGGLAWLPGGAAAAASAAAALASETSAGLARDAAVTAQGLAETARDTAAGSASTATTQAGLAAGSASAAATSAGLAADAQTAAETARTGAEDARDLAEASAALAGIENTPSPDYPGSVLRSSYPAHVSPAPHLIRLPIGVTP